MKFENQFCIKSSDIRAIDMYPACIYQIERELIKVPQLSDFNRHLFSKNTCINKTKDEFKFIVPKLNSVYEKKIFSPNIETKSLKYSFVDQYGVLHFVHKTILNDTISELKSFVDNLCMDAELLEYTDELDEPIYKLKVRPHLIVELEKHVIAKSFKTNIELLRFFNKLHESINNGNNFLVI